jgi:succinate dehydrogenase / fumarate reductase flavoprotein subunit
MFNYIPQVFKEDTADSEEEADRWYTDRKEARRPPELLPRDEVARAINNEVKEGRGTPHGGVLLDIASRRSAEEIKKALPSMYHQFKELADVDITAEPMEIGPTCHYVMGGVLVEADSAASTVPGLFAAGEVAGGMHGANRLGGNSLSDLLVFGRRAGLGAAQYAQGLESLPAVDDADVGAIVDEVLEPFNRNGGENPYSVQIDLQDTMQELVGIIRKEDEMRRALDKIAELKERAAKAAIEGHRQYNPGWHLTDDLKSLLAVSECVTTAAIERKESRGAHTRDDYPETDNEEHVKVNMVLSLDEEGNINLERRQRPEMPAELKKLLED